MNSGARDSRDACIWRNGGRACRPRSGRRRPCSCPGGRSCRGRSEPCWRRWRCSSFVISTARRRPSATCVPRLPASRLVSAKRRRSAANATSTRRCSTPISTAAWCSRSGRRSKGNCDDLPRAAVFFAYSCAYTARCSQGGGADERDILGKFQHLVWTQGATWIELDATCATVALPGSAVGCPAFHLAGTDRPRPSATTEPA